MKSLAIAVYLFSFFCLFLPIIGKPILPEKDEKSLTYNCIHQPTNNLYGGSISSNINVNLQAVLSQIQKQAMRVSIVVQTTITNTIDITTHAVKQHWPQIAMVAGAGGYLWLLWRIYQAKQWLTSPTLWASWIMSREVRFSSDSDLQKQLLQEITVRYINPDDPTDRLYPLVLFYSDIEKEIETLHVYNNWFYRLHRMYADHAVPIYVPSAEEIQELLDRSQYVRSLFRHWVAQQNVQVYFEQYADIMHERKAIPKRIILSPEHQI